MRLSPVLIDALEDMLRVLDLLILLALKNKELVLISVLHLSSPKIVQDYVDITVLNSNMPIR